MAKKMEKILTGHGVSVYLTRKDLLPLASTDSKCLVERVKIANEIKDLDLFVSLHSNAAGEGWSNAVGYTIYTSSPNGERNRAARAIIARVKEAGITLRNAPILHEMFYVLKNTKAPAVLIEHGFHTNKAEVELLKSDAYRNKLAIADSKGILDYLGITWMENEAKPPLIPDIPKEKKYSVNVGSKTIDARLIDGVTFVPLRDFAEAIKSELTVTWNEKEGAGVKL